MSDIIPYFERIKLIKLGLLPKEAVAKAKKPLKRVSDKRSLQNKADKESGDSLLDKWFKDREQDIIDSGSVCWETGEYIPEYINRYKEDEVVQVGNYRNCTAHIFPKSLFPSCAIHPLNFIILSATNGSHARFDKSIDDAKKMKVFGEAVERYLQFKHLLLENHKYRTQFEEAAQEYLEKKKP